MVVSWQSGVTRRKLQTVEWCILAVYQRIPYDLRTAAKTAMPHSHMGYAGAQLVAKIQYQRAGL